MIKQTAPAAHQGLPPARPSDPLRSPQRRRAQQPGHDEPETAPERTQPASQPRSVGRWC